MHNRGVLEQDGVNVTFDGSFEGLLNVVYAHYYEKLNPAYIYEESRCQQTLGCEYVHIETDYDRAARVFSAINKKISNDAADSVFMAFLTEDIAERKFMSIFKYIILGFKLGQDVFRYELLDFIVHVHNLARKSGREAHLLKGFCRFSETESGIYYSDISPVNNVLPILAEHFQDRLKNQPWVIHDVKRELAAIYNCEYYQIEHAPKNVRVILSDKEADYQRLWRGFHSTIAVEGRVNKKLQRQMLPYRFRDHITEFKMR